MKKLFFFTLILLVMSSGVWGADVKVTAGAKDEPSIQQAEAQLRTERES